MQMLNQTYMLIRVAEVFSDHQQSCSVVYHASSYAWSYTLLSISSSSISATLKERLQKDLEGLGVFRNQSVQVLVNHCIISAQIPELGISGPL